MESNDNGTLPEVQIRKLHISATGTSLRKPRQEIRGNVMSSQKSGPSGSRPVPESEHKKAGSKTPASCERTQIPEDHLLRRTVVTTGFPRSGLVQSPLCRVPDYAEYRFDLPILTGLQSCELGIVRRLVLNWTMLGSWIFHSISSSMTVLTQKRLMFLRAGR